MNPAIIVEGLTHEYSTYQKADGLVATVKDFFARKVTLHKALSNIDLRIHPGEMVGLLGPNGAGKTTLMKILAGLVHPSTGRVEVLGHRPYLKLPNYLRQIGMILGQKSQLMWDLPASDTLRLLKEIYHVEDDDYRDRLSFLLDSLGIAHRLQTPVRKLSLGERMKFELTAALLHEPRLLLLDEPTIGLDIPSQRAIHGFLRELNRRLRTTVILTSHYARDVEALADRLIILKRGQVQYDGALRDLLRNHEATCVLRVESPADLSGLGPGFRRVGDQRWETEVRPGNLSGTVIQVASSGPILSIGTVERPLEEVLYAMFASGGDDEGEAEVDDEED